MDGDNPEENLQELDESTNELDATRERLVSMSFRQGLGFGLGVIFALIIAALLISLVIYVAILAGLITMDDLLLL